MENQLVRFKRPQQKLQTQRKICLNRNNIIKQQNVLTKKYITAIFQTKTDETLPELFKINKRCTLNYHYYVNANKFFAKKIVTLNFTCMQFEEMFLA